MNLKALTKAWTHKDTGTVLYMLPFGNYAVTAAEHAVMAACDLTEGDNIDTYQQAFIYFESLVIDVEWGDDLPAWLQAYKMYHDRRTGDYKQDWALYTEFASLDAVLMVGEAYSQTRDRVIDPAPAPDEVEGDENEKGKLDAMPVT